MAFLIFHKLLDSDTDGPDSETSGHSDMTESLTEKTHLLKLMCLLEKTPLSTGIVGTIKHSVHLLFADKEEGGEIKGLITSLLALGLCESAYPGV